MNYTPVLTAFAGIFFFIGIQHLIISFTPKLNAVNLCFGLFVLAMCGVEVNSIFAIKAVDIISFIHSFKLTCFFLFLVQLLWVYFLTVTSKVIYRKFLILFTLLSILAIVLNQLLPIGLMRGELIGFGFRMSHFNEIESYVITKFSIYSILQFILIALANIHFVIVMFQYFRDSYIRHTIWLILTFSIVLLVEVNDFLVFYRVLDFYLLHVGFMCVILIITGVLLYNYIKSVNLFGESELKKRKWKIKEEIVYMIIHDLKLPLNILLNLSDNLSKEVIVDKVQSCSKNIQCCLQDIFDILKTENEELNLQECEFSVNRVIQIAFDNVEFFIKQKRIEFVFESKMDYFVCADKNLIERVLTNVLSNSMKYTPYGGLIKIELCEIVEGILEISVIDNGIGIEKDKLFSVFDKFAFKSEIKNPILSSTGLGLVFCEMAIKAHGTNLKVSSVLDEGTTVSFGLKIIHKSIFDCNFNIIQKYNLIVEEIPESDIKYLSKYYDLLNNCNINEISLLRKIIKIMRNDHCINKEWLAQFIDSCDNFDDNTFAELINLIRPIES